jgi:hypothetical protein
VNIRVNRQYLDADIIRLRVIFEYDGREGRDRR